MTSEPRRDRSGAPAARAGRRRLYRPEDLELRTATRTDHPFLYALLVERYEKENANIPGMAHADLPSFEEHVGHLDASPYARLEIVAADGRDVGMMYLTHDRIGGCFILKEFVARGVGIAACYKFFLTCEYPVFAHINAGNRSAYRTVERLGFVRTREEPHRLTFELREAPCDPFPDPSRRL